MIDEVQPHFRDRKKEGSGYFITVEPHFGTTPLIGPPLPMDQPSESLPTYSNGILTLLVGPPL